MDELISPKDIDPIHRYVPRQDQRNVSMRYSNQVSSWQPCRGSLRCSSRHCKEEGQIIRVDTFSRASFVVRTASGLQVLHFKKYIYSIVLLLLTIYAVIFEDYRWFITIRIHIYLVFVQVCYFSQQNLFVSGELWACPEEGH